MTPTQALGSFSPPPAASRDRSRQLALLTAGLVLSGSIHALTFVTESYPPLNFLADDGRTIIGSSSDTLREMASRAGLEASIELYPWQRAYRMAQSDPDVCVFTTARIEAREALFQWVGPLTTARWTLYARGNSPMPPAKSLDELKRLIVGRYQDDAKGTFLKQKGFTLDDARNEEQSLKKLESGRVDLWAASSDSGPWHAARLKTAIKPIFVFGEVEMYLACHPAMPQTLIDRMNVTLKGMRSDGTLQRLIDAYK